MKQRRTFSPEFKAQVVLEVLSGTKTQVEACREYQLKPELLSKLKAHLVQNAANLTARGHEVAGADTFSFPKRSGGLSICRPLGGGRSGWGDISTERHPGSIHQQVLVTGEELNAGDLQHCTPGTGYRGWQIDE